MKFNNSVVFGSCIWKHQLVAALLVIISCDISQITE